MPSKPLVIFYSRTGKTRGVATSIAQELGADREELREPRHGRSWLRCLIDVLGRRTPSILPLEHRLSDFDLLVVGSPVWASRMASPVLSFLRRHREELPPIALFVTQMGSGGDLVIEDMEREARQDALAKLTVNERAIQSGRYFDDVRRFCEQLKG